MGKTAVVGMKDCEAGRVKAQVVETTDTAILQQFASDNTEINNCLEC